MAMYVFDRRYYIMVKLMSNITNWICNLHSELSNIDLNNSTISQPQLIPKEEILCCRIAVVYNLFYDELILGLPLQLLSSVGLFI